MIQAPEDRRPPLTPQLALRVAALGTFALAMFAIIFFRLWFLQVLSGPQYIAQASQNRTRSVSIPAPRGEILDAAGNVVVSDTQALDVEIQPSALPVRMTQANATTVPAADQAVYRRLAAVLGISTRPTRCPVVLVQNGATTRLSLHMAQIPCAVSRQVLSTPYANVTVAANVPPDVEYYIEERQDRFPGVVVQQVYVRKYPYHDLAAQVFGTVGPISCNPPPGQKPNANNCELKDPHYKGIPRTDVVGQSGLEYYYNQYLQGVDGTQKFQVDAMGNFVRDLPGTPPLPGENLQTGLHMRLEQAGTQALAQSIASNPPANAGAFVAMNPDNGQVYAMGSLPSFDPNVFTKPISTTEYDNLFNNPNSGDPLLNRATQSVGPTGSTFKGISATAALQSGAWTIGETFDDTGTFCLDGQCRHNAGNAAYGVVDMVNAIRVSDDNFFYNIGALLNSPAPQGGALQSWARRYGIGRPTGIDLGGEVAGNLPTPAWRAHMDALELACERAHHVPPPEYFQPQVSCGIADGRPWSVGDDENLAVGQGDVQVSPIQLAVAYSAIANGGTIVQPHIGQAIVSPTTGRVLQRIDPPPVRHLNIDPAYLATIRAGLHAAAQAPGGTSDDVMGNFPEQVYGKTGTAQYISNGIEQDYAWYVCFVPDWATNKPILVVVHVERGGYGDVAAAPVARQILSQWFFGKTGVYQAGNSRTL